MRTILLLALVLALPGCGSVRDGFELNSSQSDASLATRCTDGVYIAADRNTADFYLTDLPGEAAAGDLSKLTGSLIHVHLFLQPMAGSTPIADDACSFTVRQVVFTDGLIGVYSGGGFLKLKGRVGARECGGAFRRATLRLTQHTPGFGDRLGPSEMNGSFSARRDDKQSAAWAQLLGRALDECAARSGR